MVEGLSPKQLKAVGLLATGASNERCAMVIGVRPTTIASWMKHDPFRSEVRRAMERMRQIFEGRIMGLAANAAVVVERMLTSNDMDVQADGAKLALNAAVRLANRYKELQVEGYVPPPIFVLPEGSRVSTVRIAPTPPTVSQPRLVEGRIVDVSARAVTIGDDDDDID